MSHVIRPHLPGGERMRGRVGGVGWKHTVPIRCLSGSLPAAIVGGVDRVFWVNLPLEKGDGYSIPTWAHYRVVLEARLLSEW